MGKVTDRQIEVLRKEAEKHINIAAHCMENACGRDHMEIAATLYWVLQILEEERNRQSGMRGRLANITTFFRRR